jgi:hypothetical protein
MALASWSTEIAQPRSIRTAGNRSFIISIEITPAGRILWPVARSGLLTQGRDSELASQRPPMFRRPGHNSNQARRFLRLLWIGGLRRKDSLVLHRKAFMHRRLVK